MNTKSLLIKLSKYYPRKIAKKYGDFHGLMVGKLKNETNKILLCLDLDYTIYDEIKKFNPDLIITHHPFIFGNKKEVLENDSIKKELYDKLIKDNIPVYSIHTAFDEGKYGMNDALCEKLELINIKPLKNDPMARGGNLKEEMTFEAFNQYLLNKLDVDFSLSFNYGSKVIKKCAIVGGGGWHSFKIAKDENYDVFISGDMPHHAQRDVLLEKYNYINIPHEVENIFMEQMKKILLSFDNTLDIMCIKHEKCPKVVLKK